MEVLLDLVPRRSGRDLERRPKAMISNPSQPPSSGRLRRRKSTGSVKTPPSRQEASNSWTNISVRRQSDCLAPKKRCD